MAAGLLVLHQGRPDAVGIEVVAGVVEEGCGIGFEEARHEALADETALAVAAVGVESIADDGPAVAYDVGDDGDQRAGHLGEVDVGVRNGGCDGCGYFPNVDDAHVGLGLG